MEPQMPHNFKKIILIHFVISGTCLPRIACLVNKFSLCQNLTCCFLEHKGPKLCFFFSFLLLKHTKYGTTYKVFSTQIVVLIWTSEVLWHWSMHEGVLVFMDVVREMWVKKLVGNDVR